MVSMKTPLTNLQLELLRVFSHNLSEEDLLELKQVLTAFFAQKAIKAANVVWDKQQWDDKKVEALLQTHIRTPKQKS
jgi:hypothetical protein